MQKNVAGQKIGCQMVSATDGSAFSGTVTVYITGDAGTQAIGTVGSGICTHEGNGYHSYAPSQAETNYDLIAFTFVGSGAVAATVQIYTRHDARLADVSHGGTSATLTFERLIGASTTSGEPALKLTGNGAGAGAYLVAGNLGHGLQIAASAGATSGVYVSGGTGMTISGSGATGFNLSGGTIGMNVSGGSFDILADIMGTLSTVTDLTNLPAITANWLTAAGLATDAVTEIQNGLSTLTAADVRTAVGLASANLDTQLDALPTATEIFAAVLTSQLTEAYAADGTAPTLAQAIFLIQQSLHEFAIAGTTRTVKKLDGVSTAATFTLDDATNPTSTTRAT